MFPIETLGTAQRSLHEKEKKMIYILSTNLKDQKMIRKALSSIYGVGDTLSKQICDDLGISASLKVCQLSPLQVDMLNQIIPQNYFIGADLQSEVRKRKERLVAVSSYRGIRHSQGLPARGQRTHGNARTVRKGQFLLTKASAKSNKTSPRNRRTTLSN